MRVETFTLEYDGGVEPQAFDHNWDLNDCVGIRGLRYDSLSGDVSDQVRASVVIVRIELQASKLQAFKNFLQGR